MMDEFPIPTRYKVKRLLLAPFGWLFTLPTYVLLILLLALAGGVYFAYYNLNVDFFGIGVPDYSQFIIDKRFENIRAGDRAWKVQFEKEQYSRFSGLVRHISPVRISEIPFLTHDILITSGEFSDPDKVNTSVINHRFYWQSPNISNPSGSINLLHTVAMSDAMYRQLLAVQNGMTVSITGREIIKIELILNGNSRFWWEDHGCNTLWVSKVEIKK